MAESCPPVSPASGKARPHLYQRWWYSFSSSSRFAKLNFLLICLFIVLALTISPFISNHRLSKSGEAMSSPFWVGVNDWGLAASKVVYECGARNMPHKQVVDTTFSHLKAAGIRVVRFWAFQTYAQSFAPDGSTRRDWSALNEVFASAQAHGIRLIPVLDNEWNDCDYWPISLYNYHYV